MKSVPRYGNSYYGAAFSPPMREQERRHCQLDYDAATTDEAKLAWLKKWGERVRDNLWTPGK